MKTSLRVFREAVRIAFSRTQMEEARLRLPASVATNEDFERFTERLLAALQIVYPPCGGQLADFSALAPARRVRFPMGREPPQGAVTPALSF